MFFPFFWKNMKNVFFTFLPQLSLPRKLKIKNLLFFFWIFLAKVIKEYNVLHFLHLYCITNLFLDYTILGDQIKIEQRFKF